MIINKIAELNDGIILSELAGNSDGAFCSKQGKGAALVMLGTYIVDHNNYISYPKGFVFKPEPKAYRNHLRRNIATARMSGAKVGISVVSIEKEYCVEFLKTAQSEGADYLSLCAHSTLDMFLRTGTSSALLKKQNWTRLRNWLDSILNTIKLPFILKIGLFDNEDVMAIYNLSSYGVHIVHVNIVDSSYGSKGLKMLKEISTSGLFVIAGGGIKNSETACGLLVHGADAVSIGSAAIKDPEICRNISEAIKSRQSISAQ